MPEPASLAEDAYNQLEQLIIFGALEAGGMYSEKFLAEQLSMGRTPVREALQKLAFQGMVHIFPRRGIQIPKVSVENQLKILEVRRAMEALCARSASKHATREQRQQMIELSDEIISSAKARDDQDFLIFLRRIHSLLVQASGNEYISQAMGGLQGLSRRFWFANKAKMENVEHPATLHAQVMRTVAEGDADAAEKASHALIDYLTDFALERLKR